MSAHVTSHTEAWCCWCKAPFKRVEYDDGRDPKPWMCYSPACGARVFPWAITLGELNRKGEPTGKIAEWLFCPTPKAAEFFEQTRRTKYSLFGGAKSVAKSYTLRWGLYRDCIRIPKLRCLLLRRTYAELENTHLLDMPDEAARLGVLGTKYLSGTREFSFANGSLIRAGHCETEADVSKFLSTQWDRIVFDEVVTFPIDIFLPIMSCARSSKPSVIAEGGAQVWGGTNPGGRNAHWVKEWFVDHDVDLERYPNYDATKWSYIPGVLEDNPYAEPGYRQTLENMPPVLRRQWLYSDWDAFEGQFFDWQARKDGQPWHVADLEMAA